MIVSPAPGPRYDQANERQFREAVAREARNTLKTGRDIELVESRLILTAPGGAQFALEVDDAGNLTAAALP